MTGRRTVWIVVALAAAALAIFMLVRLRGGRKESPAGGADGSTRSESSPAAVEAVDVTTLPRGSVAGRVTSSAGAPLAGASVCAFASSDKLVSARTRTPFCVATGPDGRYRLSDLLPANYRISASAAEHEPAQWRDAKQDKDSIELESGEAREGIDIALTPGGASVRGSVKDISGGTVAGAIVSVESGRGWGWGNHGNAVTQSDARGEWKLWTAEGSISAHAVADGYTAGSKTGIAPGQFIEIVLTPESVLQGRVVEAGTDKPVAGARVTSGGGGMMGMAATMRGGADAHSALSDEEGRFRITGLDPGRYKPEATGPHHWGTAKESVLLGLAETSPEVIVEVYPAVIVSGRVEREKGAPCVEGYVSLAEKRSSDRRSGKIEADGHVQFDAVMPGSYQVNVWCRDASSEDKYPDIEIADKDVTGILWKVSGGLSIRGNVVDASGKGVSDASVFARTKGGDPRGQMSGGGVETKSDGSFRLSGLKPGTYAIEVHRPDATGTLEPTDVKAERDVDGVRIVLPAGGGIDGTVIDGSGAPGASMQVSALGDRWRWSNASTRDDGSFSLKGLSPGEYHVRAESEWTPARAPGTKDDDVQGKAVTVKAGETAHIKLVVESRRGEIRGRVVGGDGEAVPDAFVSAERESDSAGAAPGQTRRSMQWQSQWQQGRSPVLTDVDGNFTVSKLSPGTYTVRAFRKGGGETVLEKVALGSKVTLTIKVDGSISGTVSAPKSSVPDRFVISLRDDKTGVSRSESFFRSRGAWAIRDLPEGNYNVSVDAAEGRAVAQVPLAQGEKKQGIVLELEGSGSVRGRLVALDTGEPVAAMSVFIQPSKGGGGMFGGGMRDADRKFVSDKDGRFEIERAPAGKVTVHVFPKDFRSSEFSGASVPAVLESGRANELPPIRLVRSRVKDNFLGGDLGFGLGQREPGKDPGEEPLVVKVVRPGGPAAQAGLVVGDEIVSVDGHDVGGANSYLYQGLSRVTEGTSITLGVRRGASIVIKAGKTLPP